MFPNPLAQGPLNTEIIPLVAASILSMFVNNVTSYTVPAGKILVVHAIATPYAAAQSINLSGTSAFWIGASDSHYSGQQIYLSSGTPYMTGTTTGTGNRYCLFAVAAGTVITVTSGGTPGAYIYGWLIDA